MDQFEFEPHEPVVYVRTACTDLKNELFQQLLLFGNLESGIGYATLINERCIIFSIP
jgi:hypothetical protein